MSIEAARTIISQNKSYSAREDMPVSLNALREKRQQAMKAIVDSTAVLHPETTKPLDRTQYFTRKGDHILFSREIDEVNPHKQTYTVRQEFAEGVVSRQWISWTTEEGKVGDVQVKAITMEKDRPDAIGPRGAQTPELVALSNTLTKLTKEKEEAKTKIY